MDVLIINLLLAYFINIDWCQRWRSESVATCVAVCVHSFMQRNAGPLILHETKMLVILSFYFFFFFLEILHGRYLHHKKASWLEETNRCPNLLYSGPWQSLITMGTVVKVNLHVWGKQFVIVSTLLPPPHPSRHFVSKKTKKKTVKDSRISFVWQMMPQTTTFQKGRRHRN